MPIISPTAISPHRIGGKYWATRTPSGLSVIALTDTSVKVDWVNAGTQDYGGHSIERSIDGINYSEIDTVTVGTNTFTDTVDADTYYFYRVRAYRGANYSEYTNVAELEYGPELIGNVDMSSDTWWVKGTGVTIADGVAHFINVAYNNGLSKSSTLIKGDIYRIEFTIKNYVSGILKLGSYSTPNTYTDNGTFVKEAAVSSSAIYLSSSSSSPAATFDLDNISIKKKLTAPS